MTVIDLTPYLRKKPRSLRSYGEKMTCPTCECTDFFRFYCKVDVENKVFLTAIVCDSDECDGETVIEVRNGIVT